MHIEQNIVGNLNKIALILEGLEETIIYKLLDRAQFCQNKIVYERGNSGFGSNGSDMSLFELRLFYQECMDAEFGRFLVPEERPFNSELPDPKRKIVLEYTGLCIDDFQKVNLTAKIKRAYLELLPLLCQKGDDKQYGSSVEHDVYALQAISKRIHFGAMYVAESKYSSDKAEYEKLIIENNLEAIKEKLTRKEVEQRILKRVYEKVENIQKHVNPAIRQIVNPDLIVDFYKNIIIPLTKEGEILYLMVRKRG